MTAIDNEQMSTARDISGQLWHTLQDFYSHSNWVEMGQTDINYDLGVQNFVGAIAPAGMATCSDCTDKT